MSKRHVGAVTKYGVVPAFVRSIRGLARVMVVDLGREKFQLALGRRREKRGGLKLGGGGKDQLGAVHQDFLAFPDFARRFWNSWKRSANTKTYSQTWIFDLRVVSRPFSGLERLY